MEALVATAQASHTTHWLLSSETLENGMEVSIIVDLTFEGQLWAYQGGQPWSSASASFSFNDTDLYEASGKNSRGSSIEETGAWIGDFTKSGNTYSLDTTDTITFNAFLGDTIELSLFLETQAYVPKAWESGSRADFSDSAYYTIVGAQDPLDPGTMLDVNLEIVPEPATLILLGLGGLALLRKRRT
jgi:hypothetical protein